MNNFKALKTEKSIDRIIDKIYKAKEQNDYIRAAKYKEILIALVHKWEIVKGDTMDNNPIMWGTIFNKIDGKV